MKNSVLEQISFQEKKILVTDICMMYKKIKSLSALVRNKNRNKKEGDVLNDSSIKTLFDSEKSLSIFKTILSLMRPEEKIIIENEFIKYADSDWYEGFWSKSTYYKLKHQALDSFLTLVYV